MSRAVVSAALLAAWLLAAGPGCRPRTASGKASPAPEAAAWFADEAAARGVRFTMAYSGPRPLNIRQTAGTGAALWDYDGDGWLDLFLVGQRDFTTSGGGALFRNRGDGTFEDRTAGSGLDAPGRWHGCAVGDVDNDGRPDLFLTGFGECRLFRNLGAGRFRDVTEGSGLAAPGSLAWATSAAFADVDLDGRVDLFVGRYVRFGPEDLQLCDYRGVRAACGPKSYDPQRGSLYLNRGGGRFEEVTRQMGLESQTGKTLGVTFGDMNRDGYPDLYLANDEVHADLFLNERGRRFRNVAVSSGTAGDFDGQVQGGMGVDWGDYSGDGLIDLFVGTFQYESHSLYRNRGGALFDHASATAGLGDITRDYVAFGTKFLDFDLDGRLDLLAVSGHIQDNVPEVDSATTYRQRMQLLRNLDGSRFMDVSDRAGPEFTRRLVGRGLAAGDVDNDGDVDAVVTDLEGAALLLINSVPERGNWLSVHLTGAKANRMALGAKVVVRAGGTTWMRECRTCGSYLSAGDARVHFGVGEARQADVEVRWPGGGVTRRSGVPVNQVLRIGQEG